MAQQPEMIYYGVSDLESQLGLVRIDEFIQVCEKSLLEHLFGIAADIAWNNRIKIVFISGPTSSGKTTTTNRLAGALRLRGKQARRLSLDDYYRPDMDVRYIDGRKDLESIYTLDIEAIIRDIRALLAGETVQIPIFNFKTRQRELHPEHRLSLAGGGILLVEGLHGLSESIAGRIEREAWYGIMLRPWATVTADQRLLSPRDLRMLRRTSRDVFHRSTPALATVDYWPMLDLTEEQFFPDYIARADVFINTALAYEVCVIPPVACAALRQDLERYRRGELADSPYVAPGTSYANLPAAVAEAERLIQACAELPALPADRVPGISILNEFLH